MKRLQLQTSEHQQLLNILPLAQEALEDNQRSGTLLVFCPHTTAAITVNEDYDPDVKTDILSKLARDIPRNDNYLHAEGNSDAHVKSSLVGVSETLIVEDGQIQLGRWQGLLFCEFDGPRQREVWFKFTSSK